MSGQPERQSDDDASDEGEPLPAHNAGPSVAECAANDRHWDLEKTGE